MPESASLNIQFSKRFSSNLSSNVAYFVLNIIIGLALVPFFLNTLGEASYALIPLATSLTSYVTLVIDSVNSSISRYLTIDLQHGDIQRANETYNTALFGTLVIVLLLIPIAVLVAWFIPSLFDIGDQETLSVFWLFVLIFGSVLIRSWSSNFMATLFANNRLDLRNYVNIINVSVQLILIPPLFHLITPSIECVGISYFAAAISALLSAYLFSRKVCPYLEISITSFRQEKIREIGSLSFWVILNTLGALLYTQVALILVNILCGDVAEAQYAIVYTWFILLYSIGSLITTIFTPMIYSYYSSNDTQSLIKFTSFSTKVVGLFMALPIGLVCIFSPQLLTLWVGSEYSSLSFLLCIIVIPVIIHIQASCSYAIYVSTKNVRLPAMANFVAGSITLLLSFIFTSVINWGMYGIAIAVGFGMIFRQGIFNPMYTAYILKAPMLTYFRSIWGGLAGLIVLLFFGGLFTSQIPMHTPLMLIPSGTLISALYILITWKLVITKKERSLILSCTPATIRKRIPSWLL